MGRGAGGVNGMGSRTRTTTSVSMDAVQPDFEIMSSRSTTRPRRTSRSFENEHNQRFARHPDAYRGRKRLWQAHSSREYRITSRGGKGVVNMKTTDRNGSVVATLQVTEVSDVMIITYNGKVIRVHANEIREAGPLDARRPPPSARRRRFRSRRRRPPGRERRREEVTNRAADANSALHR